jgi:DNA repair protein RadC
MPAEMWRRKGKERKHCYQCGEPIMRTEDFTTLEVYDSPWGKPKEIHLHVDNEIREDYGISCEQALYDEQWSDFRFFNCSICNRIIIRQCPSQGWHSYVRETEDGEEVCLRCWEEDIYENGLPREKFEKGQIPGMFYNRRDLEGHGFERVPGFDNFPIKTGFNARAFCDAAIRVMDEGCLVAVDYERMAIGGLEGYVTMWAKKNVSLDLVEVAHQAGGEEAGGEAMRYAYSLKTHRVKEEDFPYHGQSIRSTSELITFARSLQDADVEKFLILFLDAQNHVICIRVSEGTVNQCVVYPREVFRHALLAGASAVILIHNHPSGETKPSDADIRLTRTIAEAGKVFDIMIHDHIIIAVNRFFSFREEGIMPGIYYSGN